MFCCCLFVLDELLNIFDFFFKVVVYIVMKFSKWIIIKFFRLNLIKVSIKKMLILIKFDLGSFMIICLLNFIIICVIILEKGLEMFGGLFKMDG